MLYIVLPQILGLGLVIYWLAKDAREERQADRDKRDPNWHDRGGTEN